MQVSLLNAKEVGIELERLIAETSNFYWAVAWATEMSLADVLLANKRKIHQLVIGTDFAQTSPVLLRKLMTIQNAHIMTSKRGTTFHPKVYCFVDDKKVSAIVGSANFTNGGTYRNDEAALLLVGSTEDQSLQDILSSVSNWWDDSQTIKEDFLKAYELRWNANQKHKNAIEKPIKIYRPTKKATNPELLSTSWRDYVKSIKEKPSGRIDERLAVLQKARQVFDSQTSFHRLNELQRKAIAGIIGCNEIVGSELEQFNWDWFGSMTGFGDFKNRINENDRHLSAALEHIPSSGEISENDYLRFVAEFKNAFKNTARQGGIATASRLLAMKRPDYFVCVDSKNKKGLGADIGFPPSTLNLDNYWECVVEPVIQSSWWNVSRPKGKNGRIWDTRAAMLDVIYMNMNVN